MLLARDPEIDIVGEADNGRSGIRLVQRTMPDVVLMDIRMPGKRGNELAQRMRQIPALEKQIGEPLGLSVREAAEIAARALGARPLPDARARDAGSPWPVRAP